MPEFWRFGGSRARVWGRGIRGPQFSGHLFCRWVSLWCVPVIFAEHLELGTLGSQSTTSSSDALQSLKLFLSRGEAVSTRRLLEPQSNRNIQPCKPAPILLRLSSVYKSTLQSACDLSGKTSQDPASEARRDEHVELPLARVVRLPCLGAGNSLRPRRPASRFSVPRPLERCSCARCSLHFHSKFWRATCKRPLAI